MINSFSKFFKVSLYGDRKRLLEKRDKGIKHIEQLRDSSTKLFDNMTDWIMQPVYSPDHPLGNLVMNVIGDHTKELKKIKEDLSAAAQLDSD